MKASFEAKRWDINCESIITMISVLNLSLGFPDSSSGKESTCHAGDTSSIPRSGRSAGEGIGYPSQFSWVSLVAQLVNNPPAMQDTWV